MAHPVCVVTGVGPGNGVAFSRRFAGEGYRVAMLARSQDALKEFESKIAGASGYACDVGEPESVQETFARVRSEQEECPPKIQWSEPTSEFRIAPWYESGDAPPRVIPVPDPTEPDFLDNAKPNVAFALPKKLFNLMNNTKLDAILDGEEPSSLGFGVGWICSFNISLIFVLALMIVLMFAFLLNIVFSWMAFFKICIPYPKKEG